MNDNPRIPDNINPEILKMVDSMCAPNSAEFEQAHQFFDKFGAEGYLEIMRAHDECPVDALISSINSGFRSPENVKLMMEELANTEVYLIFDSSDEPWFFMKPSPRELIVMIFTRECHVKTFMEENDFDGWIPKKVSVADLFLKIFPERKYTLHVNFKEGGGMFEIILRAHMVNFLYNIAFHDTESIRRLWAETGKDPYQIRYGYSAPNE